MRAFLPASLYNADCGYDGGDCESAPTTTTDDDDIIEQCGVEANACVQDPACLDCLTESVNSSTDLTCGDQDDAADCSDFVNFVCCAVGESCSDNEYIVGLVGKRWVRSPVPADEEMHWYETYI